MDSREDLQRLIDVIVDELAASAARPVVRCRCHSVVDDCCPDRLRGVLDAGATRVGLHAAGGAPSDIASMIDHTLLKPDATRPHIEELCREAAQFHFATVCINPAWVALCARLLDGSGVRVCSVVGFPLGATTPDVKGYEAQRVIFDGAREVDMVINIGALSKVIIEAALLTDDEKIAACTIAKAAGADYVKTSTGFGPGGATAADVALMRRVVGPGMGVKAAGGVRDLESAKAMLEAGADRIGASVGVKIVEESYGRAGSRDM